MPTQRLSMRRIKEVLRLKHVQGLPERAIAHTLGISKGAVHNYLRRAGAAGLNWPLPAGMSDEDLELLLFPAPRPASQSPERPVPDWGYVDKELRRRNVTRRLLWDEYRATHPDGFGYTWFCTTYEAWKGRAGLRCGRPIWAARRFSWISPATPSTSSTLKWGSAVDEAVRGGDGRVQSYMRRGLPKRGARRASRAELFAELDKPKLTKLPDQAYAFARWKRCRVGPGYHIEIDGHWYSAPYRLIRELVDARIDDRTVEIFHNGRRIASHARAPNADRWRDRRGGTASPCSPGAGAPGLRMTAARRHKPTWLGAQS